MYLDNNFTRSLYGLEGKCDKSTLDKYRSNKLHPCFLEELFRSFKICLYY